MDIQHYHTFPHKQLLNTSNIPEGGKRKQALHLQHISIQQEKEKVFTPQ